MRYLVVAESCFHDRPGGAHRVAWDIALLMRDRGHEVTLLCYHPGGPAGEVPEGRAVLDGIEVVRFRKPSLPSWSPGRLAAIVGAAEQAVRRWLAGRGFEVVHVHTPLVGLGVAQALGAGPRYVYTVHSPVVAEQEIVWRSQGWAGRVKLLLGRRLLARVEARMLARAARIHTLSDYTRRELDRAYGVGSRVTVVPHWVTREYRGLQRGPAREALGWPAAARVFFTVRAMGPRYGLDIAIRALAPLLVAHDAYFVLAGEGPSRPGLEALARSTMARLAPDQADRIRFLGRISDATLEQAYAAADLFILPTLALECFGLITIEALALGCPVLATDAGAIPEAMLPILPQLVVPAGDELALRERARDFLEGRIDVPPAAALRDYATRRYGRAAVTAQLARLIEEPA